MDRLEQVVALRRGSFMEGFSCDSAPFEEWVLAKRAEVDQQMLAALRRLAAHYEEQGEYERAIRYARKQLELEPWDEEAHRQLMRALALNGQRSAALAQYEACCRALKQELGVEPSSETRALYESIRDETLAAGQRPGVLTKREGLARTIQGYDLLDQIGQGAFGVIYRARQRHVDRQVAIKVILPEHANQPDFIRHFETEARLVAQLEHLHIVPLYDYWRDPDGAYLVMRLMRGGSLEKRLERGPLGLDETARLLDQIGSALATAHRQGVIHRDLKPANILLDEEGNAYLSDFGIAKSLTSRPGQSRAAGQAIRAPAYISPEQLQRQSPTPQADIYSLGVLLFEMLTGQPPFVGGSTGDLIAEHLPLPSLREARPDLPAELDRVIQCATAQDPADRYVDVMALVADARRALAPKAAAQPVAPAPELTPTVTNPYKGLRAFQESDALDFFGREALTQQLLARMGPLPGPLPEGEGGERWGRFLAVVGPSGSGKSSVVRAGLLPAIRRGALPGSGQWFVVEMLPGAHPLEELEIGLLQIAAHQHGGLMEQLRRDERGLVRAARLVLPSDDSRLLLIVDQFEELFTLVQDKAEATHFMDSLAAAISDPRSPVRVILTLRADFYDRPLTHPEFSALMGKHTQVVTPLTTDELARAIAGPAERAGAALEPGLVTNIIADVKDQPGALPLLQYALTELFEQREGHLLTKQAYESIGGVMGALGCRAEEVYAALDPSGQEAARQLFLRLVTLGEGIEDTRRRVLRSELESLIPTIGDSPSAISYPPSAISYPPSAISHPPSAIPHVIEAFGASRLLSLDRDPLTRGPTIEVAHEALLREWKRLREWLDAGRADVRMLRLLTGEAAEWQAARRDASFLLSGARLAQFEGWAAETKLALTQDERAFLDASLAERQKREDEEAARQRRELETAQTLAEAQRQRAETEKRRAEEQTRAAGQLRRRAMGLASALVIAALFAIVAFIASQRATQSAATAQAEARTRATAEAVAKAEANVRATAEAVAKSEAIVRATAEASAVQERQNALRQAAILLAQQAENEVQYGNPDRGVLLALEALVNYPYTAQAEHALGQAVTLSRAERFLAGHTSTVGGVAWSPDGKQVATASTEGTVRIWDAATGKEARRLQVNNQAYTVAWSPDGNSLMFTTGDRFLGYRGDQGVDVFLWDVRQAAPIAVYTAPTYTIFIEGVTTGVAEKISLAENTSHSAAFSPDGRRLAFITDQTATVWDLAQSKAVLELAGHTDLVYSVAWSPNGRRLVTAGQDQTARIWDAADGRVLQTLSGGHTQPATAAVFSPDGARVATSAQDGLAVIWDAITGQKLLQITTDATRVWDVTWSPDGKRLATANESGVVQVWDTATGQATFALRGHEGRVVSVAWSADGRHLLSGSRDSTAYIWKATPGTEAFTLDDPSGTVLGADWTPDGRRILTGGGTWLELGVMDGVVREWDVETGKQLRALEPVQDALYQVTFSPDGRYFMTHQDPIVTDKDVITVWDYAQGKIINAIPVVYHKDGGFVRNAAWSPDGKRIAAVTNTGLAKVFDAFTGQELVSFTGHPPGIFLIHVAWSRDGKWIGTSAIADDPRVRIWDAQTGQERIKLEHQEAANSIAWSPAGDRICTGSGSLESGGTDNVIRLWDAETGQLQRVIYGHTLAIWRCGWSPDGQRVFSASQDGTTRVWDAATGAELLRLPTPTIWSLDAFWSPSGKYVATVGDEQPARLWRVWQSTQELVDYARQCCVVRDLTAKERERFGLR